MSKARFIALLAAITLINVSFLFGQIAVTPASGDGSEAFPFQIATLENLFWIAAPDSIVPNPNRSVRWACHYQQTANIDASDTENWYGGEGWIPIGDNNIPFSGVYDGQNHTIYRLLINRPTVSSQACFGDAVNAMLINVNLKSINVNASSYAGGLCGDMASSEVINSSVQGSIVAHHDSLPNRNGGLVGYLASSIIQDSHATCVVQAPLEGIAVGGLVGLSYDSTISNCYSNSYVVGGQHIGGLVGFISESTVINSCYSNGFVAGKHYTGGLIGWNVAGCTVQDSFSASQVLSLTAGSTTIGGLIGAISYSSYPVDSFWDIEVSGQPSSAGGIGKTTNEMMQASTYLNWDFEDTWLIHQGGLTYPYFQWQDKHSCLGVSNIESAVSGSVSKVGVNW